MPRGNIQQCKVIFKGKNDDFIVFVESLEDVEKWKKDSSIPLAQVLNGWKIFYSDKHGAQGILNEASKSHLENEFGTSAEEKIIEKILRSGSPQVSTASERQGVTNISGGPTVSH
ncbi:hypothetical protein Q9L58_007501 [Maublancomyces gigas]|uniref:Ribosome maturation protein SDO1/SBDS N-terminal domain-containing protein n=1 Tax=Discina gigas TaxID=1032678 RepID=A0ABR3GDG5_9PEZI